MENNFGLDLIKNSYDSLKETNYQLGAVQKEVLMPDGDWTVMQPECEIQKSEIVDYMDCVTESAINIISMLLQKQYGIKENWSQRFTAKMSGTTRQGNSLYAVANSIRKDGLVLEVDWSRNKLMSWAEYYKVPASAIKQKGKNWVIKFDVNYETVPVNDNALKNALKYAPVQVIGYAWIGENGVYHDYGYNPNHAFVLGKFLSNGQMVAIDSYPTDYLIDENSDKQEFFKVLASDFHFGDAMLYTIKAKEIVSLLNKLKNMINDIWVWFEVTGSPKGLRAYYVPKDSKGTPKGKQELKFDTLEDLIITVKALFSAIFTSNLFKKTSWPEVKDLEDVKFI